MKLLKPSTIKKRLIFTAILGFGLAIFAGNASAQTAPPQGPPQPPPSPDQLFHKIFKKKKKDTAQAPVVTPAPNTKSITPGNPPAPGTAPAPRTAPGTPPPPPPNPLDLFKKKKKKDTVKNAPVQTKPTPVHQS